MGDCVVLTPAELRICRWVGRQRRSSAQRHGRVPADGPTKYVAPADASLDIRGVECEFAASIVLNMSWRPTIGQIDQPDIGDGVDVRSTELANGRLIVKPKDAERPFVLVVKMSADTFRVPGWLMASEAKARFPLLTGHGDAAHFVPQERLRPIDELRRALNHQSVSNGDKWCHDPQHAAAYGEPTLSPL